MIFPGGGRARARAQRAARPGTGSPETKLFQKGMGSSHRPVLGMQHFGPGSGPILGKIFPNVEIPRVKMWAPKGAPRPGARRGPKRVSTQRGRPEARVAWAPAPPPGPPKGGEQVSKIGPRRRPKVRRPGAANAPDRWPRVAAVDDCGGTRSSPDGAGGVRGGARPGGPARREVRGQAGLSRARRLRQSRAPEVGARPV